MSETELLISIVEVGADPERVDELTGYLQRDLLEMGVESVKRPTGRSIPEGAKGDPLVELGTLALATVPTLLPKLLTFLQMWAFRGDDRAVTIKTPAGLEVTFVPERRLSELELISLVEKLTGKDTQEAALIEEEPSNRLVRTHLRQILSSKFDEEELKTLSFDLGVAYNDLPGQGRANKARDLVDYLERRGRLDDLLAIGSQQRPDIAWEVS